MNDLITAATSGLFVEVGKIIEHMKAQQARIADLERQLAEASAPAVEQQKPEHVAYAENGVLHWMTGRKFQNCELYTAPQAADTDKVREAIFRIANELEGGYFDDIPDEVARCVEELRNAASAIGGVK